MVKERGRVWCMKMDNCDEDGYDVDNDSNDDDGEDSKVDDNEDGDGLSV